MRPKIALVGLTAIIILLSLAASGTMAIAPSMLGMPNWIFLAIFILIGLLLIARAVLRVAEIKSLIILFGAAGSAGLSFFNFVLFLLAYKSPTKSFIVPVNVYGEAEVELVLLFITVSLVAYSTLRIFKHIYAGKRI